MVYNYVVMTIVSVDVIISYRTNRSFTKLFEIYE